MTSQPTKRGCRECNQIEWHDAATQCSLIDPAYPDDLGVSSPVLDSERVPAESVVPESGQVERHEFACEGNENCTRDAEFRTKINGQASLYTDGWVRLCRVCRDAAKANGILEETRPLKDAHAPDEPPQCRAKGCVEPPKNCEYCEVHHMRLCGSLHHPSIAESPAPAVDEGVSERIWIERSVIKNLIAQHRANAQAARVRLRLTEQNSIEERLYLSIRDSERNFAGALEGLLHRPADPREESAACKN